MFNVTTWLGMVSADDEREKTGIGSSTLLVLVVVWNLGTPSQEANDWRFSLVSKRLASKVTSCSLLLLLLAIMVKYLCMVDFKGFRKCVYCWDKETMSMLCAFVGRCLFCCLLKFVRHRHTSVPSPRIEKIPKFTVHCAVLLRNDYY